MNSFLTIPPTEYPQLAFPMWGSFDVCMVILFKLSLGIKRFLGWDVEFARSKVDFETLLQRTIQNLHGLLKGREGGLEGKDMYTMHYQIWQDTLDAYTRKKFLPLHERIPSSSVEVHRRAFEGGSKNSPSSEAESPRQKPKHPCPAHIMWKNG